MRIPEINKATKMGEPSFTVGGIADWWKSVWKTYRELKTSLLYVPPSSNTPWHVSKGLTILHTDTCSAVSLVLYSQPLEQGDKLNAHQVMLWEGV